MVVVINGMPKVGKSLFVGLCREVDSSVYEYSTVDFVKEVAQHCGWDGQKTPENRKFLSNLKDLLTQWDDVPFKKSISYIKSKDSDSIVFIHCREPKEIQRFKDYFGNQCRTLLIRRSAVESNDQSNHADAEVFNYSYNYMINNDGSIGELYTMAEKFIRMLRSELCQM